MILLFLLGCRGEEPAPAAPPVARPDAPAGAPNVVLISLDTVRADHLTPYGYSRDTTPFLAEFAAGGARFTTSYAQAASTTPTHASLFTSRYPHDHQAFGYNRRLEDSELTLAEHLQAHGWATVAATSSMKFDEGSGFSQGFDAYHIFGDEPKNERSAQVNAAVRAFASESAARPYFAFVHYFDAHAPYAPPAPWTTRWHPGGLKPEPEETIDFIDANRSLSEVVPPETLAYLEALYDGGLGYLDSNVRALLADLPQNGRQTLVIITSDHGEEFKEHGYLGHSTYLHEEIIQVPLLVSWPGVVPAGLQISGLVQSVDLLPTLVELLGLPAPPQVAGRSFARQLRGEPDAPLAQRFPDAADALILFARAENWGIAATLEGQRFKLVKQQNQALELYRLDNDPRADRDVLRQHQPQAQRLLALAQQAGLPTSGAVNLRASGAREMSAEQREQLKALGYMDEANE